MRSETRSAGLSLRKRCSPLIEPRLVVVPLRRGRWRVSAASPVPTGAGVVASAGTPASFQGSAGANHLAVVFGTLAEPPADAAPDEAWAYSERPLEMCKSAWRTIATKDPEFIQPGSTTPPTAKSVIGCASRAASRPPPR